jgi:hypothetical protein
MLQQTATIDLDETRHDEDYLIDRVFLNTADDRIPITLNPPIIIVKCETGSYALNWDRTTYSPIRYLNSARALATLLVLAAIGTSVQRAAENAKYYPAGYTRPGGAPADTGPGKYDIDAMRRRIRHHINSQPVANQSATSAGEHKIRCTKPAPRDNQT